ncbi:unnamed protein product [marine sediment metagenome]|uniref:Uncharacterized protein n=1 Tax=marine sediment metagenome TaxID=412755 RepID=X1C394_9ZZZZ
MRVVIILKGGLVQEVFTDEPMDCIIIDKDVHDGGEASEFFDTEGDKFTASIKQYEIQADNEVCEHYYKQIPAS